MKTAMLVDGQNLLMRSFFASQHTQMSTATGFVTAPLVIFANILSRHVREERPDRLLLTWDGGTSKVRQDRLPSYKAKREAVPDEKDEHLDPIGQLAREFCALVNISTIRLNGVEADDLIAGAWAALTPVDADRIVILSQDKDFIQLIGQNPHAIPTELVRMGSANTKTDRWDAARVLKEYGYHPWNWPLVTALAGDEGDGVPGLPGIGPVKATKLLEAGKWNWHDTLALLADDKPTAKNPMTAVEKRELAQACADVVDLRDIRVAIPVPLWRPTTYGSMTWQKLIDFLTRYELRALKDRVQEGTLWSDTQSDDEQAVSAP